MKGRAERAGGAAAGERNPVGRTAGPRGAAGGRPADPAPTGDAGRGTRRPTGPAVRVHLWIEGRVQGVWFRESTREEAERLGVAGWVRNLPDGRVEAVLEGPEGAVAEMERWCRRGPERAHVERVEAKAEPLEGLDRFEVRR